MDYRSGNPKQKAALTDFFERIEHDPRVGISHIALFTALFYLRQRRAEIGPLTVMRSDIMAKAKIYSLSCYHKTIRDLAELGYIRYVPSRTPKGSKVYFNE
jgi:hypothetical protein